MSKLTTILFDLEGVVIGTQQFWRESIIELCRLRGVNLDVETIAHKMVGRSLLEGAHVIKEEFGFTDDAAALAEERKVITKVGFESGVNWIPGFRDFYEQVKDQYKTAIATALNDEFLEIVDSQLNLRALFNGNVFSIGHVGHKGKPNPDVFLYAAKQLNSEPSECVVIEDAPNGVEAAKRAGMKVIGITNTFKREQLLGADIIIESFEELNLDQVIDTL